MVYREQSYSFSDDGNPGWYVFELDYEDLLNWKVTTLEGPSGLRSGPGEWHSYENGTTLGGYDPVTGETTSRDVSGDGGFYAPDEWLMPVYIPKLLAQPMKGRYIEQKQADRAGLELLIISEDLPCIPPTDADKRAGIQECASEEEIRTYSTEITYTAEELIPMQIVHKGDGIATYTMTVESLTFK
jgi:hypothetical protein